MLLKFGGNCEAVELSEATVPAHLVTKKVSIKPQMIVCPGYWHCFKTYDHVGFQFQLFFFSFLGMIVQIIFFSHTTLFFSQNFSSHFRFLSTSLSLPPPPPPPIMGNDAGKAP